MTNPTHRARRLEPGKPITAGTWLLVRFGSFGNQIARVVHDVDFSKPGAHPVTVRKWRGTSESWTGFVVVYWGQIVGQLDPSDSAVKKLPPIPDARPVAAAAPGPEAGMADPQTVRQDQYEGGIDFNVAGGTG